jgi:sulfite reductase beta subunit-like hemoprotein
VGFAVFVGGTVASSPQLAQPLNVIVKPEEIRAVAKSVAEIFRDYGSREIKAKSRFRWLVDAWGTEKLRKAIEEKMGKPLEPYLPQSRPTCRGEHIGVQAQKQEGYSYINIPVVGGVLSSQKMQQIAGIAEEFGSGDFRLTPFQNIILTNIPDKKVNVVLKSLQEIGYPAGNTCLKWTIVACAGNFCGKTICHPKNDAKEIADYLELRFGDRLRKASLRVSFSGCPNGCARHLITDIGLQGVALTSEGKSVPGYNLYIRESTGVSALAKLVQRGIAAEQVKFALANLIDFYLQNGGKMSITEFYGRKKG